MGESGGRVFWRGMGGCEGRGRGSVGCDGVLWLGWEWYFEVDFLFERVWAWGGSLGLRCFLIGEIFGGIERGLVLKVGRYAEGPSVSTGVMIVAY